MWKPGSHYRVLAEKSGDESPAVFPQPKEILPVYLYNEQMHGEFCMRTVLQSEDEPLYVMLAVQQVLCIQMCREPNAVVRLARAPTCVAESSTYA